MIHLSGDAFRIALMTAIPNNEYYEYYGPDYELDVRASNMTDHNTPEYLDKLREAVFEVLRDKNGAPSVQMHGQSMKLLVLTSRGPNASP